MEKRISVIAFSLLMIAVVVSCRKEKTTWDADMLVPLAHGSVTISDLVTDSILQADESGLWHLILNENLTDFDLDTLVAIQDTIIKKKFVVPIVGGPFPIPNGQVIIDEEENNQLTVNDVQLKEVVVESGTLEYSIKSYINGYLNCTYDIPGVTLNGNGIVIQNTTQPSTGGVPYQFQGSIDLSDHHFDLTGSTGFLYNRIYTHLTIAADANSPSQTLVSGNDSVVVELKFVDPVVRYARGFFGEHHYELNESVDFSDNVNFPTGVLNIGEAMMNLNIRNYIGVDAQIDFHSLTDYNSYNDITVQLEHNELYQPINLTRAFDDNGVVIPTEVSFEMNNSNSNIDNFIENLPDFLSLDADVTINPLGNISDGNDFIYTAQALDAELSLDVPLNIGLYNLQLTDTISITTSVELDASGHLFLYVENEFPFSAYCDAYLINTEGNLLNILCNHEIVQAGVETSTPGVTIPAQSIIDLKVNEYAIQNFNPENRIVIRLNLNSPDLHTNSGIYSHYKMNFQVVADGTIELGYD